MKSYLVTGGTGSFGKEFVKKLNSLSSVKRIIVFSRDELKQYEMQSIINSSKVSFILGDVRDRSRLQEISEGVDVIIHAAAMKQIPASELNPSEAIHTNINGAENVIWAARINSVRKVLALSTDKAANPANLYGATKLCSDKLFVSANNLSDEKSTKFAVVRYGNVLGSRGSVIPFFKLAADNGEVPITHPEMTRFWISLKQAVEFILERLSNMHGGEIFVPKIPSFKVTDVAKIVAPNAKQTIIGVRPGEKLHEVMITEDDSLHTIEYPKYFSIVLPELYEKILSETKGKSVQPGFKYSSDSNPEWFDKNTFTQILKNNNLI